MADRIKKITRNYLMHPEGSVLIETGDTKVICTATVVEGVPPFLRNSGKGWVTAEYGMLPRSTNTRNTRPGPTRNMNGRASEIQRLIGRSLRAVVDFEKMPDYTIQIDCDVIQADGGTRTASITGACVAMRDAFQWMLDKGLIVENPMQEMVAAISVGVVNGENVVDLCYDEDSNADVDMNVVMTESGRFIEIQATGEKDTFSIEQHIQLLELADEGIRELIVLQREA